MKNPLRAFACLLAALVVFDLSGDLQIGLKPYWMYGSSTSMTTHGSPYPYDTHVPILETPGS